MPFNISRRFRISVILPTSNLGAMAFDKRPKIDSQNARAVDESIGFAVVDGIAEATGKGSTGFEALESLGSGVAAGGGGGKVGGAISGAGGAG